jgi:glyoxylase-like metal-dependent hydrolase (beta-lactamase superfamily II)
MAQANCYLYSKDSGKAAVIDPGWDGERIAKEIEIRKLEPALIINTHGHADHTGANGFLAKKYATPLLIHEGDAHLLGPRSTEIHKKDAEVIGILPFLDSFFIESPEADRHLTDGEIVAPFNLKVLHTPGHSKGGISLYQPEDNIIFTGDTLFALGVGRTDIGSGDWEQLLRSIKERLFTLPPDTIVYPGHGPTTTIGREMTQNPFVAMR